MRGRRSKGKGKGEGERAREEGGGRREEGNACKQTIVFATQPTKKKNNKNDAKWILDKNIIYINMHAKSLC